MMVINEKESFQEELWNEVKMLKEVKNKREKEEKQSIILLYRLPKKNRKQPIDNKIYFKSIYLRLNL